MLHSLKTKDSRLKTSAGFTLVELLVVVVVIGILSSFAIVTFTGYQERGRDAKRKSDIRNIQAALQLYYQDHGAFPDAGCNTGTYCVSGHSTWTTLFNSSNLGLNYIREAPMDPKNTCTGQAVLPFTNGNGCYGYAYSRFSNSTGEAYLLVTKLENTKDPQANKDVQLIVGTSAPFTVVGSGLGAGTYMVTNP